LITAKSNVCDKTDVNDLARQARSGNQEAFDHLVRKLMPVLHRFFRKRGGVDAEELTQQTLYRLASNITAYDPNRDFRSWIFAIAYYEWVNELRRQGKKPERLVGDPVAIAGEARTANEDLIDKLHECMKQLTDDERTIIYLRYWDDLSLELVADHMQVPYGALKGKAFRVVVKLRNCMSNNR
jgi:RNA polymerase sigma-70 factor (ECF subfamily)